MRTIISHIYNEEYLLPWWLNHHKKYFDHGIIIDYASTDNSVNIIKNICPTWDVYQSKNKYFTARDIDSEVVSYENLIPNGQFRIVLNVTEFLIGDYKNLDTLSGNYQFLIPCLYFIDDIFNNTGISVNNKLWEIIHTGIDIDESMYIRRSRSLHNYSIEYPLGRHFDKYNTQSFIIFNYGYAPMTTEFKTRKIQIQSKIPIEEIKQGLANGHSNYGKGLDEDGLYTFWLDYKTKSKDLKTIMNTYLGLME